MVVIMSIYILDLQNLTKIILLPCIVQTSFYILFYMFTYSLNVATEQRFNISLGIILVST